VVVAGHVFAPLRSGTFGSGAVSEMSAALLPCLTALLRIEVAETPRRLEHPVVVGAAPRAHAQVDCRTREALARIFTAQLDLDVLVHDRNPGIAAGITFLGAQQLVERTQVDHVPAPSRVTA